MTTRLARLVAPDARICVGFSGGVDSSVLLDILARAGRDGHGWRVSALHVHHGLSPNADAWAKHCEHVAAQLEVPLRIDRVRVVPRGEGLEAAARAARHAAFDRLDVDVVALAHHDDDQAETLLLNLVRGAGVAGLAAMPLMRAGSDGSPAFVRPLLGADRARVRAYAVERGLSWIEDESNEDERLQRNFVRRQVVPSLVRIQPAAVANLARTAWRMAAADEVLRGVAREDLARAEEGGGWSVARLLALGEARAMGALRALFVDRGLKPPSTAQLEDLHAQLASPRGDAGPTVTLRGLTLRRYRGRLVIAGEAGPGPFAEARWNGASEWPVPAFGGTLRFLRADGQGIDAGVLASEPVRLRARSGGERFRPVGAAHHRTLKNLYQERGVPPWERIAAPLLYIGDVLAWVPAVGVAARFQAMGDRPGLVPSWHAEKADSADPNAVIK